MMNEHSAQTPRPQLPGQDGSPPQKQPPGNGGTSPQQQPPDHRQYPRQYFLPGKLVIHVEDSEGHDSKTLAALVDEGLRRFGDNLFKQVQPCNIVTFPQQNDQGSIFSIMPVELNSTRQEDLLKVLQRIYGEIRDPGKPYELGEGVIWRSVAPDWLLGSATHGGSNPPSPGSWPLAKPARKRARKFLFRGKNSTKAGPLPFASRKGGDVHVAILDTAPSHIDLDEAHENWRNENELINRLLEPEPNRKLRLVTDFYAEIELLDCSLARHRYWIADHGLFIAGEIASIAPEATIHLYKVFTSYGSSSILTLAQGLLRVLTDLQEGKIRRPLVVNCSFGLAAPLPGEPPSDFPAGLRDAAILGHMQISLRALFDQLTNQKDVIVVAAAGDDTDLDLFPDQPRAPARLPAAYDSVIGVGALPKGFPLESGHFKAASYSNLADNPPDTGYMTLGGEPGPGQGIVGIYTSELPNFHSTYGDGWKGRGHLPPKPEDPTRDRFGYSHNKSGNVEWAGASFAAPIITAILANWCSEQISAGGSITLNDARQALNDMSQPITTDRNERVILVTQG